MVFNIAGKVALITGAADGIGLAYAEALLSNGLKGLCMVDINQEKGDTEFRRLTKTYGESVKIKFIQFDLSDSDHIKDIFEETITYFEKLDIVINNAGIADEMNIEKTIKVNLTAVTIGTSLALEIYLRKYKSGNDAIIINTASVAGLVAMSFFPTYTATKFGVVGLGRAFGTDFHYNRTNVKVMTICPGGTDTSIIHKMNLPKDYNDVFKQTDITFQPRIALGNSLIQIIQTGQTGSVWTVNKGKCEEVKFPEIFHMNKL